MRPDLGRATSLTIAWAAVTIGLDLVLRAAIPGIDVRMASLGIIAAVAVALAVGVTWAHWWREVGYTPASSWRETQWLVVAAAIGLAPLAAGLRPIDPDTYLVLIAGYALTGFAEETMFRGLLVKLLEQRRPIAIAAITALLFGLVHLGNIVIRGEVAVILAQALGATAFGFGFAALRLSTNAILPLVVIHAVDDLVLQMSALPLIPTAVVQDILLFAIGLWLLRTPPASKGEVRA
jgi:membrane protease YdiL (CAAX protease family)